jgi:hypothetical protein
MVLSISSSKHAETDKVNYNYKTSTLQPRQLAVIKHTLFFLFHLTNIPKQIQLTIRRTPTAKVTFAVIEFNSASLKIKHSDNCSRRVPSNRAR